MTAACPLFAPFAKAWVLGIIGALDERGRFTSHQEIPRGKQSWNPTLKKPKGVAPGHPNPNVVILSAA